jgi:alcohol dehydrogenase YqhD (iron-dependent ADH family)
MYKYLETQSTGVLMTGVEPKWFSNEAESPLYSTFQLMHARQLACMHVCHLVVMHEPERRCELVCISRIITLVLHN